MESFFKKLQEVADLPTSVAEDAQASLSQPAATAASTIDGARRSDAPTADEDVDVDDLREMLRDCQRELQSVTIKWNDLRVESASMSEEYAAYKLKVQTWREQMRVARAQDKKTIELLRATGASSSSSGHPTEGGYTGGGDAGGSPPPAQANLPSSSASTTSRSEEVYTRSLEEQVRQLKESLRQYSDERNALTIELQRVKDAHRRELEASALVPAIPPQTPPLSTGGEPHPSTHAPPVGTAMGSNGASASIDADEVRRLKLLVESKSDALRQAQAEVKRLEQEHEHLIEEQHQSAVQLAATVEAHEAELRRVQQRLDVDKSAEYIRSLESEVRMWKTEALLAQKLSGPASTSTGTAVAAAAADRNHTDEALQALQQKWERTEETLVATKLALENRDTELQMLRSQMQQLEEENHLRDESLHRLILDCQEHELRWSQSRAEIQSLQTQRAELALEVELRNQDVQLAREEGEVLRDRASQAQTQLQQLSRECSSVNEMLRQLKLELARTQQLAAAAPVSSLSSVSKSDEVTGGGLSVDPEMGGDDSISGRDTAATARQLLKAARSAVTDVAALFRSRRAASGTGSEPLLVQEQVRRLWDQWSQRRREVVGASLRRWHLLLVLFVLLVVLFSLYQGVSVMRAVHHEEQDAAGTMLSEASAKVALETCRREMLRLTSSSTTAVGGVGAKVAPLLQPLQHSITAGL